MMLEFTVVQGQVQTDLAVFRSTLTSHDHILAT
jgi:hypothetical protein